MIILGLNAYHADAAAAIVVDGKLIAAAAEERFRRRKHWAGLPTQAVEYCLQAAGIAPQDIDHIAVNRNPKANLMKKVLYSFTKRPSVALVRDRLKNANKVLDVRRELESGFELPPNTIKGAVHQIEHHRAHLGSSFFVSSFDTAAVVSVDGFGDFVSTTIGLGHGGKLTLIDRIIFPHSLGLFYLAMTQYLGFHSYGDEYKVMGLAAYGEPEYLEELRRMITFLPQGRFTLNLDYFLHHAEGVAMTWEGGEPSLGRAYSDDLVKLLGDARVPGEAITKRHNNVAASLQALYEEAFFHILLHVAERTEERSLCLAGGCALNSVANGHIMNRTPFEKIYIPPAAGDDGGAVGAAFSVWYENLGHQREFVMDRPGWGPEFELRTIEKVLSAKESALSHSGCVVQIFEDDEKRCRWTAERLADGKIVGWFQGRMEWGARALGQRSILADPRRSEMKDVLNARIKHRESFRPFAPSILEEAVGDYFEQTAPSPFMTMTYQVRPEKQKLIPAPTHVDGTGRLQTVNRLTQPLFWKLIKEFERLTNIPVLLNTSFNENEPIVCNPDEALECFLRTGMDVLVLGPYVIEATGKI